MNLTKILHNSIFGALIAIVSMHAWAAPVPLVQVSGEVGFSCGTGTGGFEKLCGNGEHIENGAFSIVYDPLGPDQDDSADTDFFSYEILSFHMNIRQVHRPDLDFSLVGRGIMNMYVRYGRETGITWTMTLAEENDVFMPSTFVFNLAREPINAHPNELPTADFWKAGEVWGYGGGGAPAHETDWLYSASVSGRDIERPVPEPVSSFLLLIGAVAALTQRQRSPKGNC